MKQGITKRYRNPNQRLNKWAYLFIAPFILTFLVFSLYPMISSIALSFTNDNATTMIEDFTVFSNYQLIFKEKAFWHSFINTFIIFAMNFIPQLISALFFAALFTSKRIRMKGKGFFQFVYFLPNILTATSVAALFIFLFGYTGLREGAYHGGPIYELLVFMGMDPKFHLLENPWSTRIIIAFIQFWMWFGNSMIVYIAGIKGISDEIYEAADLDGASPFRVFFSITLPILKPIMLYSLITSLIGGLQMFDIPYMIQGNDFQSGAFQGLNGTKTITIYIYEFMKDNMDYGVASAASVILFALSLSLSILMYFLFFKEKNHDKKTWRKIKRYGV